MLCPFWFFLAILAALLFLQAHACLRAFAPAFFSSLDSFPRTAMIHLFLNNLDCIFCEVFLGCPR